MPSKTLVAIVLVAVCAGSSHAQDGLDLVAKERIGNLRIGGSEADVKKNVDCPLKS